MVDITKAKSIGSQNIKIKVDAFVYTPVLKYLSRTDYTPVGCMYYPRSSIVSYGLEKGISCVGNGL